MKSNLFMVFVAAYLLTSYTGPISESYSIEPQDKQPSCSLDNRNCLIKMAEEKFGKLTEADINLFTKVAGGNLANYTEGGDKDKLENANSWGEGRTINANRIEWLCHDKKAKELVTDKGIQVTGAKIVGVVDLGFAEVPFPLTFLGCVFTEEINMNSSRIKFLVLGGSHTGSILAYGVKVEGSVFLRNGFKANGEVRFSGSVIGGDFDCHNGEFINKGGIAIFADGMDVKGSVFLTEDFNANGEVRFLKAVIGRNFDCHKGNFININKEKDAILANGMDVKGNVFLINGFKAEGQVSFVRAMIGGDFSCYDGNFINVNKKGYAIIADEMDVRGSIFLGYGFRANGGVRFPAASIGGDFDCDRGEFNNIDGNAIFADGIDVKGGVFLRYGFKANGGVRFPVATIGNNFECDRGEFNNIYGKAIFADGMDVKGSVFLRDGFKANGEVRFLGADIGGDFDCKNGIFINEHGAAISADGMDVKGCVFMRGDFKAYGEVRFLGAEIGGSFYCENGKFINEGGKAIYADGMDVKGNVYLSNDFKAEGQVILMSAIVGKDFFWRSVTLPEKTILDLRNAKAGILCDDKNSWPAKGNLLLDGFVYENIRDDAPKDANSRIEWIQKQYDPNKKAPQFRPQPYEQLATVLQKSGHENDAKQVLIAKSEDRIRWGPKLSTSEIVWYRIFGPIIGYGYKPLKALRWIGTIIVIGFIFFGIGYITHVIVPTEKDAYIHEKERQLRKGYPKFSVFGALMYSIEMFVPVIDLRMAKYWIPDANQWLGVVVRGYMWVHIIAGWILTTLLIVGLTGLIK